MKLVETETIYNFDCKDPVADDFRMALKFHQREKWCHMIIMGSTGKGKPVLISSMHDSDIIHMMESAKYSMFRR